MKTRHLVFPALACLVWLSACGARVPKLPPLRPDHQELIRARNDDHIGQRYKLAGPSGFRFAPPVQDRVPVWHWEPHVEGKKHSFGHHHGWRVDYWFKPNYDGYPEQPESARMAFFAEGDLRGIFCESHQTTPLDVGKWDRIWVDPLWGRPPAPDAAPR
ncbi:MAG TPA: hypothetical protein VF384_11990 [Planctomycetota bacterium]